MAGTTHIVFDDFLRELKKQGFSLSQNDYIEFTVIFDQYGGDKESFKYFLAPIVCRSKEEQEKFYAIYDRFYLGVAAESQSGRVLEKGKEVDRSIISILLRSFIFWVCFLLLLGGGIRLRMLLLHHHEPVTMITAPSDSAASQPEQAATKRSGPVFVAKKMKPHTDSGEVKSIVQPIGQPIEKQNTVHSTAFAWLVVLGLACLGASTSFFPQKRSKFLPEVDLDTRTGDDAPVDIPFLSKDHLIQKLPLLTRISGDLIRPIPTGLFLLDIKRTIVESVNNYGLLLPVYKNMERPPEYLVLIDRRNILFYPLFRYLTRAFIADAVNIDTYFFDDAYSFFPEGSERAVDIYGLRERHPNAQLIVMGEGNLFSRDLRTVSADMENFVHLVQNLHEEDPDTGYLSDRGICFYPDRYPDLEDMDVLREYLGDDDLFQWVCAIAIYPTVKWEMIVAIGSALLGESRVLYKLNFASLLKIAGIGWLHSRSIPHELRVALLQRLQIHPEIIARKKILELLKESDDLLDADSIIYKEKLLLEYTQSFVLYASDVRGNKQYEQYARKFLSIWDKQAVPDLATVIYLKNRDNKWDTPVRSMDNAARSVGVNKFMNELLALRVISDPTIRRYLRNAGVTCFALLCLLFLFKDVIGDWTIGKNLGLVDREYVSNTVVVNIPVTDCLKKRVSDGRLTVALNNYDNNRYTRTFSIIDKDSLKVVFEDITMNDKDPEKPSFQVILNNDLTIACMYKEFYPQYNLVLQGTDCSNDFHPNTPHYEAPPPGALTQ